MKGWKLILQALIGILSAGCAALGMGTWVFPEEKDLIAAFAGFRLSVCGAGAGLSLLTILAFADGWIGARNRRDPDNRGAGRVWNGLGFGLLPGILVWKIFERQTFLAAGTRAAEEFGTDGWFLAAGSWRPERMEILAAGILFAAVILWLLLRKNELPENGDLMGVVLASWCAVRLVTEGFRANQIALLGANRIVGWLACGAMTLTLLFWARRTLRQRKNTGYVWICIPVFVVSIAALTLIQNQIVFTGNAIADLAMQGCLALLALKAALCLGRVSR